MLVREVGYLHDRKAVDLLFGARDLVDAARGRGLIVGLVTNQSGVGRRMFDWDAFEAVQRELGRQLSRDERSFAFDFVAACGAHAEALISHLRVNAHPWRKPQPGMLLHAAAALDIDMAASVLVGDQASDIVAGLAAGVGRCVHVLTGQGEEHRSAVRELARREDAGRVLLADDLDDVRRLLDWTCPPP